MKIKIRQENSTDYAEVAQLIEAAFKNEEYSDHTEHLLVDRLRYSNAFIPELSLIAELEKQIVGHILLTKIKIVNEHNSFDSLALAPVSVKPDFQKQGIGGQLIKAAHQKAMDLGHHSIVLLGHAQYYPKFGYELTSKYNIKLPFDAPEANCMIIELTKGSLQDVFGTVEYDKAFYE